MDTFKGTWNRRTQVDTLAPLKPGVDPQHLEPTDQQYIDMSPLWVNTAPAPDLPGELYPYAERPLPTGEGPVDHTPRSHADGMGGAYGLTQPEAVERRAEYMSSDDGAVAAHGWHQMVDRDGEPHFDFVDDENGPAAAYDSVATHQYERTGVGQPNDPDARRAARQQRWYQRYIDFHRYPVELRPVVPKVAYSAPSQPATPGATQYDSPYTTSPGWDPGSPDRFVAPQTRRAPGRWDEAMTSDATTEALAGELAGYGLTTWGL